MRGEEINEEASFRKKGSIPSAPVCDVLFGYRSESEGGDGSGNRSRRGMGVRYSESRMGGSLKDVAGRVKMLIE